VKLITGSHVDDPVFDPFLPRVGCGICELNEKPINVQAVPDDNQVVSDEQMLEAMAKWSREHAATHTEAEHQEHERRRREA
jgi:hypothetical protein